CIGKQERVDTRRGFGVPQSDGGERGHGERRKPDPVSGYLVDRVYQGRKPSLRVVLTADFRVGEGKPAPGEARLRKPIDDLLPATSHLVESTVVPANQRELTEVRILRITAPTERRGCRFCELFRLGERALEQGSHRHHRGRRPLVV